MDPRFKDFLDDRDEKRILEAIARAEKNTSGEIRVHLHRGAKGDVMENARRTFEKLGMHKTALRNGILIYIDVDNKRYAILGDKGIHEKVGRAFWEKLSHEMHRYFSTMRYVEGIVKVIDLIGRELKKYFPYHEDDINELPDDISYD
jgi:uncharacterized membrane protein